MSILKEGKPVGLACDHAGYEMKQIVMQELDVRGIAYKDFGTYSTDSCDYPDFAHPLALAVEAGECYPRPIYFGRTLPRDSRRIFEYRFRGRSPSKENR